MLTNSKQPPPNKRSKAIDATQLQQPSQNKWSIAIAATQLQQSSPNKQINSYWCYPAPAAFSKQTNKKLVMLPISNNLLHTNKSKATDATQLQQPSPNNQINSYWCYPAPATFSKQTNQYLLYRCWPAPAAFSNQTNNSYWCYPSPIAFSKHRKK